MVEIRLLWVLSAIGFVAAQSPPVVNSKVGKITGAACPNTNANRFLGVPFAQPPIDSLRFLPPKAYNGTGNIDATKQKPFCYQFSYSSRFSGIPISEDCLYLNIYVPSSATANSSLPVKFFLHGGAFVNGGTGEPTYTGCNLAGDAIVVTAAYRLGPLGFLALPDAGIAGNMAIRDEIMGLQWVQDNIAAFGGNPKEVLLFGESAGAISGYIIASLPDAPTLMKAFIGESGAGLPPSSPQVVVNASTALVTALGCSTTDISCLRSKSADEISAAIPPVTSLNIASVSGNGFSPIVDGKLITGNPLTTGSKVPMIAGTNSNEGASFITGFPNNGTTLTAENYTTIVGAFAGAGAVSAVTNIYPLSLYSTAPNPVFEALAHIATVVFKCTNLLALQNTVNNSVPAWTYLFDHTPSCPWLPKTQLGGLSYKESLAYFGATHTSELPFVWAGLNETNIEPGCQFTPAEYQISETLVAAWTSMAINGNPGNVTTWPRYETTSQGLIINDGVSSGFINNTECQIWLPILTEQFIGSQGGSNSTSTGTTATSSATPSSTASTGAGALLKMNGITVITGLVAATAMMF